MKKLRFAGIIVSGMAAAVLALASPAEADYGHHQWVSSMGSSASVPHANTNPHH